MDELLKRDPFDVLNDAAALATIVAMPLGDREKVRAWLVKEGVRAPVADKALKDAEKVVAAPQPSPDPYAEADTSPLARIKARGLESRLTIFEPENVTTLAALWLDDQTEVRALLDHWREEGVRNPQEIQNAIKREAKKLADQRARSDVEASGNVVISPATPLKTARLIIEHSLPTLVRFDDQWLAHQGAKYRALEDATVRREIYRFLETTILRESSLPTDPAPWLANPVDEVMRIEVHRERDQFPPPCWLHPEPSDPDPREIVACSNGLLHLPTKRLLPSTPRFFNVNALDFAYQSPAPVPTRWLQFLDELWPDSPATVALLQEVFGYLLSQDTRQQKIFMLLGPSRSGKGTIARVLMRLIGLENCTTQTISQLGTQFGLQSAIGKQLMTMTDLYVTRAGDKGQATERILNVSGEDRVTIQRKNLTDWHGKLPTRILMIATVAPILPDMSGALPNRYVPMVIKRDFADRQDTELSDKLFLELPGILEWAVGGYQRLHERGYFVQTNDGREILDDIRTKSNPVSAFLTEQCRLVQGALVSKDELYWAFESWAEGVDGLSHVPSESEFGRLLLTAGKSAISKSRPVVEGKQVPHYVGIRLGAGVDV